jgi:chemotaxis protein CheD
MSALPAPRETSHLQLPEARLRRPGEASFFFHDAHFGRAAVKVLPGEFFVHDADIVISTTLGSCIAACLWDRQAGVGGMNHFLLPEHDGAGGASARYGSSAMELLINELLRRGAARGALEAKVFGGAQVLQGMHRLNIGERNTDFVFEYLRTERIAVVSQDVRGTCPRKVCFLPASGRALVKRLAPATAPALLAEERAAAERTFAASGTVDLF